MSSPMPGYVNLAFSSRPRILHRRKGEVSSTQDLPFSPRPDASTVNSEAFIRHLSKNNLLVTYRRKRERVKIQASRFVKRPPPPGINLQRLNAHKRTFVLFLQRLNAHERTFVIFFFFSNVHVLATEQSCPSPPRSGYRPCLSLDSAL